MQKCVKTLLWLVVVLFTWNTPVAFASECVVKNNPFGNALKDTNGDFIIDEEDSFKVNKLEAGSLATQLAEFYDPQGKCSGDIKLETFVYLEDQINIRSVGGKGALVIDGSAGVNGKTDLLSQFGADTDDAANSSLFYVENTSFTLKNVTIRNADVTDKEASVPVLRCSGGSQVTLENVTIRNAPSNAIMFQDCSDVKLTNVVFDDEVKQVSEAGQTKYNPELNPGISTGALVQFQSVNNLTIDGFTVTENTSLFTRDAIVFKGGSDVSLSAIDIAGQGSLGAIAVNLFGVTNLEQLDVTRVVNSGSTAILLDHIDNGGVNKTYNIGDLRGLGYTSAVTTPIDKYVYQNSDAVGVLESSNITLNISGTVSGFAGSGVVVQGTSEDVFITSGIVSENAGYGVIVNSGANNISVKNIITKNNGNCGVAIEEAQVIEGVEFVNNGQACSLGVPQSLVLNSNAVSLFATDETSASFDLSRDYRPDGSANMELHYYYAEALKRGGSKKSPKTGSGVTPIWANNNTTTSSVPSASGPLDPLPKKDIQVSSVKDTFLLIIQDQFGVVTGVWHGDLSSFIPNSCLSEFNPKDGGGCSCIQGNTADELTRVYHPTADTDRDGLLDHQELGFCISNSSTVDTSSPEYTDPTLVDTDEDGMSDFDERLNYFDPNGVVGKRPHPLQRDTDNDGMIDGDEDSCVTKAGRVGFYDLNCETSAVNSDTDGDSISDNEEVNGDGIYDELFDTNPVLSDTDGDGILDNDDEFPLCDQTRGVCTYSDCVDVQAINDALGTSFSEADLLAAESSFADDDGDGVPNVIEDTNRNCSYDQGETNPLDADTDGDGCTDGEEDLNRNGLFTGENETDPRNVDTDGDLIQDGIEQPGCAQYTLGLGNSNPLSADTDGDGIGDGIEDLNFNGVVDAGETNPANADSDNDRLLDSPYPVAVIVNDNGLVEPSVAGLDLSPMVYDPTNQTIVYYCGVSDFNGIDSDGDTLPDASESPECRLDANSVGTSNPFLADTDGDGLRDDLEACFKTSAWASDTDADGLSDYAEASSNGKISDETLRATCATGFAANLGATDPLSVTNSCSLNSNLLATSRGSWPITIIATLLMGLLGLRMRKTLA